MPDDRNEKERQEEWTISKDWIAMAIRDGVQQALKENWHTIKEELIDVVRQLAATVGLSIAMAKVSSVFGFRTPMSHQANGGRRMNSENGGG
jgi:hypothetical protein